MTDAERAAGYAAQAIALDRLASLRPALAAYAGLAAECDPLPWCHNRWHHGHIVWLPRVDGDTLTWHPLRDASALRPGWRGLREPDPHRAPPRPLPDAVLLIVPGLGFAPDGVRLGQGGGFYDRLLATRGRGWCAVGLGWTCQWRTALPHAAHDQRLDAVLIGGVLIPGAGRPGIVS